MASIGDILGKEQALAIGQMMLASGTITAAGTPPAKAAVAEPEPDLSTEAGILMGNRSELFRGMEAGRYMPLGPQHASNFDELQQTARSQGFTSLRVMLETGDRGTVASDRIVPTGEGEATVIVNQAALRPTPEFTRDFTEHQISQGRYRELSPADAANYSAMTQAAVDAGYTKPPRVMLDATDSNPTPSMSASALPDGTPLVRVNIAAHEWSQHFTREHLMMRDEDLSRQIISGEFVDASTRMDPSVYRYMQDSAARRGLTDIRAFVDSTVQSPTVSAQAVETVGGARHIEVNEAFLQLKPEQQRAVIDHELAHFQLGHTSAQGLTTSVNALRTGDAVHSPRMEALADRVAVCQAYDPQVTGRHLADALVIMGDSHIDEYRRHGNRDASVREALDNLNQRDRAHPPIEQRITDIRDYSGSCSAVAPLATPKDAPSGSSLQK